MTCPEFKKFKANYYYELSKTIVFWTDIFLILCAVIAGKSHWIYVIIIKIPQIAAERIVGIFYLKPLDMKPFEEDTMLARQKRKHEHNQVDKNDIFIRWIKRKKDEIFRREQLSIYDMLARGLDFILNIGSRDTVNSIPYEEPRSRDMRLFRNLNVIHKKSQDFTKKSSLNICTQCGYAQK